MKIKLASTYGIQNYRGTNDRGQSMQFSGKKEAVSPMESVLMASAACSSIDIESLLEKMRQPLERIEVDVEGKRAEGAIPAVFTHIHLHYRIYGNVKPEKAEKAVKMSMETYCSVSIMLAKAAEISYTYEVIESE